MTKIHRISLDSTLREPATPKHISEFLETVLRRYQDGSHSVDHHRLNRESRKNPFEDGNA